MAATPADLQKIMAGGGGMAAKGPDPIAAAAPGNSAPGGGPMTTPQPKAGIEQAAMVNIALALDLLEQSLPAFGSENPRGKAINDALRTLTKEFGNERAKAQDLQGAEVKQLMQTVPAAGGGPPAAAAIGGIPPNKPAVQ